MSDEEKLKANISKAVEAVQKGPTAKVPPPPAPRQLGKPLVTGKQLPAVPEDPAAKYLGKTLAAPAAPEAPAEEAPAAAPEAAAEEVSAAEEPKKEEKPKPTAMPVTVDSSTVRTSVGTMEVLAAISSLRKVRASYSVVMVHSGYKAEMTALSFQEIAALQTSITDAHAQRLKMLRIVFQRMTSPSVKMDEARFLSGTAESDLNTLLFGIYASTYPGKNDYNVRCRHCGVDNTCVHTPNELIRIKSDDVYGVIEAILASNGDKEFATRQAPVSKSIHVKLPETGVVVEIRDPSLQDTLSHIDFFQKKVDPRTGEPRRGSEGYDSLVELAVHVKQLLIPDRGGLLPITDLEMRVQVIGALSQEDGRALTDAIEAEIKRLAVEFKVPDFNCVKCKKANDNLFLNFERVLFDKMAR